MALYLYDLLSDPGGDQNDYDLFQYRFSEGVERFLFALIDMEQDPGRLHSLQKMVPSLLLGDTEDFALIKRIYPTFALKMKGIV